MGKIKNIVCGIILILIIPVLLVSVVILLDSYIHPDEVPSFFSWKPFIVLSGSMESEILPGDLVIVKETEEELKKGDIIAFRQEDIVITHRIEEVINEDETVKYITKGDNNNTVDQGYVLPEQIEGIFKFKISGLGNLAIFVQTPIGMISCLSIPIILLILIQMSDTRKSKRYIKEKNDKEKNMQEEIERLKKQNEELQKK